MQRESRRGRKKRKGGADEDARFFEAHGNVPEKDLGRGVERVRWRIRKKHQRGRKGEIERRHRRVQVRDGKNDSKTAENRSLLVGVTAMLLEQLRTEIKVRRGENRAKEDKKVL